MGVTKRLRFNVSSRFVIQGSTSILFFSSLSHRSKDIHESSYLPFIFPSTSNVAADDSVYEAFPRKIAGRRTFNNNGEEVSQLVKSSRSLAWLLNLEVITVIRLLRQTSFPQQPQALLNHPQNGKYTPDLSRYLLQEHQGN